MGHQPELLERDAPGEPAGVLTDELADVPVVPPLNGGRRGRILRAAAGLFRQRGFDRTTMREIAEVVGLTKGSLYHHVRGKQALLYEIIQHTVDRALPRLEYIAALPLPAAERLRRAVRLHILIVAHDRDNVECSIEEGRSLAPEYRDAAIAGRDRYERLIRDVISDGIRGGEFAPTDVRLAGLALLGMVNWVARWYRPDGERPADAIASQFGDPAVAMLRAGMPPSVCAGMPSGVGETPADATGSVHRAGAPREIGGGA